MIKEILGIDISEHNGAINWKAAIQKGVKFVIARCSYGKTNRDPTFAENIFEAKANGLKCGAYHYSYALTASDVMQEAMNCKETIERAGILLELPVFYDMEDGDGFKRRHGFKLNRRQITRFCEVFIKEMKPLNVGIYANYDWLKNYIDWKQLNCSVWNAQWGKNDDIKGYIWQFTDSLDIGGKKLDGDILYLEGGEDVESEV